LVYIHACFAGDIFRAEEALAVIRLFTGVPVPETAARELERLRGGLHGARWVDPQAYHITLSFIGEVEGTLAGEIITALAGVEAPPFRVRLAGIGSFGSRKPRAIWVGVEASAALERLQARQASVLAALGVELEKRKFRPHVTLARLKGGSVPEAGRFIERHNLFRGTPFDVDEFLLYSSRPSRGGGPYAVEAGFPLDGATEAKSS
jgi:2'-5' RNA ligase